MALNPTAFGTPSQGIMVAPDQTVTDYDAVARQQAADAAARREQDAGIPGQTQAREDAVNQANTIMQPWLDGQQEQITGINNFYQDPARMQEVNSAISAEQNLQQTQLQRALEGRQLQEAFARARSGNIGGSVETEQNASLEADAFRGSADLAAASETARFQAEQALEASRVNEIMSTYNLDPFTQAALQEQLTGLGLQSDAAAVQAAGQAQMQQLQNYFNDELSRIIGSAVNTVSSAIEVNRYAQAMGYQGLW